jgi:aspartate aminotransferase-like enzyme
MIFLSVVVNNRILVTNKEKTTLSFFTFNNWNFKSKSVETPFTVPVHLHLLLELAVLKLYQEQFHNRILSQNTKGSNSNKITTFINCFV